MSDVDFEILGSVTVRVGAGTDAVRLREQSVLLLGRLLLEPGARVTTDALADALWGAEDRADRRNGVQQAVRAVRALLDDTARPFRLVVRDGDAYRLVVDPLRVDATRFRRLAALGRDLAGRRPRAARAMLEEALATWGGRLLGEHAERPWAVGYARELDSLRDQAELDLNEARLALAEFADLEPGLRRQIARRPHDERLRAQLLSALHGAGRTAEAMAAYREAVRELGGVGPELRRVGEEIARGTIAAGATPDGAAPSAARGDRAVLWARIEAGGRAAGGPGLGTATLVVHAHGGDPDPIAPDRLVATFGDPAAALGAAAAIVSHRRLPAAIGVHVGGVVQLGDGIAGPGLARCRELAAVAHPGQVLLSEAAAKRGAAGRELRNLGPRRLADLSEHVRVFELPAAGHEDAFPPLATLDHLPHNLPVQQTGFVGRRAELAALSRLVAGGELVTLTGPGGCGKTRLALQLAARHLPAFADGAWFVALSELTADAPGQPVAMAVARELGVRALPGEQLLDAIPRQLADRFKLLVLDNCEHVHDECVQLVGALLAACPDVFVLATSRRPLRVEGERIWPVPPIGMVARGDARGPSDAALLLLERSEFLHAEAPTADTLACAERICRALDGMPLAIELAAGQVMTHGLEAVAIEVEAMMTGDRPLDLFPGPGGRRPARQCTLEAAIDWSYRLLDDHERRVLRRLAVFRGSFAAVDAAGVAAGGELDPAEVSKVLVALVESSMVIPAAPVAGAARLRLLEPIRAFALVRLEEEGELARAREAHAHAFRAVAERCAPQLFGPGEQRGLDRFEADHDNLRGALAWCIEHGRSEQALRLVGALWWLWFSHGHLEEGGSWVRRALALDGEPTRARVRALRAGSHLAWWRGDFARTVHDNEALADCAAAIDDEWGRAWVPMGVGAVELFSDPVAALALFEDSKRRFEALRRRWEAGYALQLIGGARWFAGDERGARAAFDEAVEIFDRLRHPSVLASVRRGAGLMAACCGNRARGIAQCRAALRLSDAIGDRAGSAQALNFLAAISRYDGDLRAAVVQYAEALSLAREVGELWATCWALDGVAGAARAAGEREIAARLLAHSTTLSARAGFRVPPREMELREHDIAQLRIELDAEDFERASAEGELMSVGEAVACALAFAARYEGARGSAAPRPGVLNSSA